MNGASRSEPWPTAGGTIVITARKPVLGGALHFWPNELLPTVAIDDEPVVELPWDEPITFEVAFGEHDVVVNPDGPRPTVDTCCWVDEEGVRLEYVTAHRRSLRWDRIRYLD